MHKNVYDFKPGTTLVAALSSYKVCKRILERAPSKSSGNSNDQVVNKPIFCRLYKYVCDSVFDASVMNTVECGIVMNIFPLNRGHLIYVWVLKFNEDEFRRLFR